MRIAVVVDWFAEAMGYAENSLPRALAALGQDVHVVTSDVQPYFGTDLYARVYEPFLGPGVVACGTRELDGFVLHRLPHGRIGRSLRIRGLRRRLRELRPDIVQCFDARSASTIEAVLARRQCGYRLFLGSHVHASVFDTSGALRRLRWAVHARTVGRLIDRACERCYAISSDAAEIATRHFGLSPRKVCVMPLGVDTALFRPAAGEDEIAAARALRARLGAGEGDLVCIYTGRLSPDKAPLDLALAVDRLVREGTPAHGLFIGGGAPDYVERIRACSGCSVLPFVPARELPRHYHAADVGVWPRQESTSQLDAAACGLPLVLSDRIEVTERVEGNGLLYREGDVADLAQQIRRLADPALRSRMGAEGSRRIRELYSWDGIARARLADYQRAVRG